jgi:hypothetical protein
MGSVSEGGGTVAPADFASAATEARARVPSTRLSDEPALEG